MELYTNSKDRTVYLETFVKPKQGTAEINLFRGGEQVATVDKANYDGEFVSFKLPYFLNINEQRLNVEWKFSYEEDGKEYKYLNTSVIEVITPILSTQEILSIHPNATPDEVVRIEKATRHIINAHTGQSFGRYIGIHKVTGNGNRVIQMPMRLLKLNKVNGLDASRKFQIGAGGWTLINLPWGVPPLKADYHELHQHVGGVIHNPNNVRLGDWEASRGYDIDGEWGWEEVPAQVREAARLLINDYACADINYRDRYLTSMTAADWRIQYHSGAFRKTGNVRADQLLADFVLKRGWTVI